MAGPPLPLGALGLSPAPGDPYSPYIAALPCASVATQKEEEGHDTDTPSLGPNTPLAGAHELPLYVSAFPLLPTTAAQNDADGHDTDAAPPMLAPALQELPLYVSVFPLQSTAMQNDDDTHDSPPIPSVPSMSAGADQALPL